ncbi:DUF1499 domain-containing protein [Deinococcus planocerae]|uniref:DUF1499 domain-containing protein n=1 Tax=Deinococcus planocerae TaxID=1737569 RepID=UPI0011AFA6F9|nr:DUF1499 domain-containing protein [Deinococcus planocerae]
MRRLLWVPVLVLAACAPRFQPPVTYAASRAQVLATVAQTLETDRRAPGGWNIVQRDEGYLKAEARSPRVFADGPNAGIRESVTVMVSVAGDETVATVSISTSPAAAYVDRRITAALDARFKRR